MIEDVEKNSTQTAHLLAMQQALAAAEAHNKENSNQSAEISTTQDEVADSQEQNPKDSSSGESEEENKSADPGKISNKTTDIIAPNID
ncbi:MAG: hypothetical protein ACI4BI_05345, partial [Anaerotardibacter sp.]